MKPGKPLARRASLKPRAVQMKQGAKLPAQSKRTKQRQPDRVATIQATKDRAGHRCEAVDLLPEIACWGHLDTNEIVGRGRGGSPLDPSNTNLLCRAHHIWVTDHPLEAERLELSAPSGPCAKSILLIDREESA